MVQQLHAKGWLHLIFHILEFFLILFSSRCIENRAVGVFFGGGGKNVLFSTESYSYFAMAFRQGFLLPSYKICCEKLASCVIGWVGIFSNDVGLCWLVFMERNEARDVSCLYK